MISALVALRKWFSRMSVVPLFLRGLAFRASIFISGIVFSGGICCFSVGCWGGSIRFMVGVYMGGCGLGG